MTDLRKLAEAATPGPWRLCRVGDDLRIYAPNPTLGEIAVAGDMLTMDLSTATFLAACSPDRILALLDRAERAERERDEARAERDARPEITVEDAALISSLTWGCVIDSATQERITEALRAHAAKAVSNG